MIHLPRNVLLYREQCGWYVLEVWILSSWSEDCRVLCSQTVKLLSDLLKLVEAFQSRSLWFALSPGCDVNPKAWPSEISLEIQGVHLDPLMWQDLNSKFGVSCIHTDSCCCYFAWFFQPGLGLLSFRFFEVLLSTQAVQESAKDWRGLFTDSRLFSEAPSGISPTLSVQLL